MEDLLKKGNHFSVMILGHHKLDLVTEIRASNYWREVILKCPSHFMNVWIRRLWIYHSWEQRSIILVSFPLGWGTQYFLLQPPGFYLILINWRLRKRWPFAPPKPERQTSLPPNGTNKSNLFELSDTHELKCSLRTSYENNGCLKY